MVRTWSSVIFGVLLAIPTSQAQAQGFQFKWQAGQVITYRVEHTTTAVDVIKDNKAESTSKLALVKRWHVAAVDEAGVATLQLSLASMRMEMSRPTGDPLIFDSANPEKSDPGLREQLSKFINEPLAVLRVDAKGRVVQVKESKFGPASRYESELPLIIAFPDETPKVGQAWRRDYRITLEPPQGVGEKYDAAQTCRLQKLENGIATIALTTAALKLPEAVADQVPLLQFQPAGEIVFDMEKGMVRRAKWSIDKELKGHQGDGSSYRFQSTFVQELVEGP